MTRALVMIFAVGLALAVFCFACSGLLFGNSWGPNGPHVKIAGHSWASHWVHFDLDDGPHGPVATRDYAWTGGDKLELDAPVDLQYTQGPVAKLTITGPKDILDRITVQNGRIEMDGVVFNRGSLKAVMTAPNITSFETNGSQDITIADYKQDQLHLAIHGSGDVTAAGQAAHADLSISGSGDADLGGLTGDEAIVRISGSGDATIAPKTLADVTVSGSGDVTLRTKPTTLRSNISGSGSINQVGGGTIEQKDD